ncbi:MAG: aldolase/citrate lyase family protein [Pirellulaceae bacterium]|nr:aldolase/citrate lyase family protein [Pirellulaceae bacterium]
MRPSRIRTKLARKEPILITCLHFADPALFEMTSLMGFDGIWLDMEHHGVSLERATQLMAATRVGASDIVARPAKGEFVRMARMLEVGANAIMYPQCDTATEAAEVVRWCKFPPMGRRGFDGANADVPFLSKTMTEYTQAANEQTVVIMQIETADALENVEEIAQVDGIDILMMGPADLSLQLGVPDDFSHPKLMDAMKRIAEAAGQFGKDWGRPAGSPEEAQTFLEMGARFITSGADIVSVKLAHEAMQAAYGRLGFTFDNKLA